MQDQTDNILSQINCLDYGLDYGLDGSLLDFIFVKQVARNLIIIWKVAENNQISLSSSSFYAFVSL